MEKVLEAVHATDCKIAPQLWHVGMARPFKGENLPNPELPPIGPSGIDVNTLGQTEEPMSIAKIEEVINALRGRLRTPSGWVLMVWNCMERTAT